MDDGFTECGYQLGQGVAEVAILAAPIAVALHDHSAAEDVVPGVKGREPFAFGRAQELLDERIAMVLQRLGSLLRVEGIDAPG